MTSTPRVFVSTLLLALTALAGCSTPYASRDACERSEAAFRGRAIGFMLASAASDSGRQVVREHGKTVVTTQNKGNVGLLALGTWVGHVAGGALHDASRDSSPDDVRAYTGNWYGKCAPSDLPSGS